jgi:hypothetical protein
MMKIIIRKRRAGDGLDSLKTAIYPAHLMEQSIFGVQSMSHYALSSAKH